MSIQKQETRAKTHTKGKRMGGRVAYICMYVYIYTYIYVLFLFWGLRVLRINSEKHAFKWVRMPICPSASMPATLPCKCSLFIHSTAWHSCTGKEIYISVLDVCMCTFDCMHGNSCLFVYFESLCLYILYTYAYTYIYDVCIYIHIYIYVYVDYNV